MKLVKKGLFGDKNISLKYLSKNKELKINYNTIICTFTSNDILKKLIFKFINNLKYNISMKVLDNQLSLIKPLTLDDKIKILNITLDKNWQSLIPAYKLITMNKFDNINSKYSCKKVNSNDIDLVNEDF